MEAAKKSAKVCDLSYVRFLFKKMGKEKDAVREAFYALAASFL